MTLYKEQWLKLLDMAARAVRHGSESVVASQYRGRVHRVRESQYGKINMGASGPGSWSQLYGELFKTMTGIEMAAVQCGREGRRRKSAGARTEYREMSNT